MDYRSQSAVSDLFHGLSEEEIKGCGWHDRKKDGSSYWNSASICEEAFAHMFEGQFDKIRYNEMKKYFPSILEKFEEILRENVK